MTKARNVDIRLEKPLRYELDGGDRPKVKRLKARIEPGAIVVAVPADGAK